MIKQTIERWHRIVETNDMSDLNDLLADDCVFWSPVVHTPQEGKMKTTMYLTGANQTFQDSGFHYVREVLDGNDAVLEFKCTIDGIEINGIDMIRINDDGKIVEFKVLVRPLKAINLLHAKMKAMLEQLGSAAPTPG